jgi:hypothetical protein
LLFLVVCALVVLAGWCVCVSWTRHADVLIQSTI